MQAFSVARRCAQVFPLHPLRSEEGSDPSGDRQIRASCVCARQTRVTGGTGFDFDDEPLRRA